jgi:chemotaxis-related protein WspB
VRRQSSDFSPAGVRVDDAAYLGPVATDQRGVVQLVDVSALLPHDIQDLLFTHAVES